MGILGSLLSIGGSVIGGMVGGPVGAGIGGSLGSAVGGQIEGSSANGASRDAQVTAASQAAQAETQARQLAIQDYNNSFQQSLNSLESGARESAGYYRPMLGRKPYQLTPAQLIEREDNLRQGRASLAASGLRGAGRAGVAALLDSDRLFTAGAYDENRRASDTARNYLANLSENLGVRQSAGYQGQGTAVGNYRIGVGTAMADAARATGEAQAGYATAQGKLSSDTAGRVGSIIQDGLDVFGKNWFGGSGGSGGSGGTSAKYSPKSTMDA